MQLQPTYKEAATGSAYQLRFHFGWYCRGRKRLFDSVSVKEVIDNSLRRIADTHNYHLLESDVRPNVLRSLLSLQPNQSPSDVSRVVKGNLAKQLREQSGQRNVWARGVFVRSVGNVTGDVIRNYIAGQFAHHRAVPVEHPEVTALARFHDSRDSSVLQKDSHSVFEYNVHLVLVVERRSEFLDLEVATDVHFFSIPIQRDAQVSL